MNINCSKLVVVQLHLNHFSPKLVGTKWWVYVIMARGQSLRILFCVVVLGLCKWTLAIITIDEIGPPPSTVTNTTIRIYGTHFNSSISVCIGAKPCLNPNVSSTGDLLTCVAPPGTGKDVEVTVTVNAQQVFGHLTYTPPTISDIFPYSSNKLEVTVLSLVIFLRDFIREANLGWVVRIRVKCVQMDNAFLVIGCLKTE